MAPPLDDESMTPCPFAFPPAAKQIELLGQDIPHKKFIPEGILCCVHVFAPSVVLYMEAP